MKRLLSITKILLSTLCFGGYIYGQHSFFSPKEAFTIEISLPNTKLKRLPIYRNEISSLMVKGDYIIGGTTAREGLSPFLFVASLSQRELINYYDVEEWITGQRSISTGFYTAQNGLIYAGTMPNKKSDGLTGEGNILEISLNSAGSLEINDLGAPVPGEGIFTLLANEIDLEIYGISYPSGIFFKYSIAEGTSKVFDDLKPAPHELQSLYDFAQEPSSYLGKKLVQDNRGLIWGSMPINKIFCYDPRDNSFNIFKDAIPQVWGRRTLGQVESWAKAPDGKLFGGNAGDGQLFMLDPATGNVKNLGKPIMATGLKELVFAGNGRFYGIAGEKPAETHLFTWTEEEGFVDMGNPRFEMKAPGIEQGIEWRGFQIGSMAASDDGKYLVLGEEESLSQVMVFKIGED